MLELSAQDARRLAVRAQLLAQPRPTELLDTVRALAGIQHDLTNHVLPHPDLVLWGRLGRRFDPDELQAALDDHRLVEVMGFLRVADDLALYRAEMAAWPQGTGKTKPYHPSLVSWVSDNGQCREDVLATLRADGPLPSRDLPDTCVRPWRSSGWTDGKNLRKMLTFMEARGEVAVSAREGREPLWDLAERVYPDVTPVPLWEAAAERDRRLLAAVGIARSTIYDGYRVHDAGVEARVTGVTGTWRVDAQLLDQPFRGRAALLSPLGRLVFDRRRMDELFDFDYQLEMYKPAHARRWGYWAMPLLYGDRLVGKLDAESDMNAGVLRIHALHEDVAFTPTMRRVFDDEIASLAALLELEIVRD